VIVKRFDAIQNLGAISILCSDKTGTLTMDHVQVSASTTGSGDPSHLPLQLAYLNSALQTGTRSALDGAIVEFVQEGGFSKPDNQKSLDSGLDVKVEEWNKLAEVPFDSARRLLSVLVSRSKIGTEEKGLLITKGAVEEVLNCCTRVYDHPSSESSSSSVNLTNFKPEANTTLPLTSDGRLQILQTAERFNREGLRLVAVACKSAVAMSFVTATTADETDLVFIGFLCFLDPLKPDAADAITRMSKMGVQVRLFYSRLGGFLIGEDRSASSLGTLRVSRLKLPGILAS
jgi:Mg2+-importing ATPase